MARSFCEGDATIKQSDWGKWEDDTAKKSERIKALGAEPKPEGSAATGGAEAETAQFLTSDPGLAGRG